MPLRRSRLRGSCLLDRRLRLDTRWGFARCSWRLIGFWRLCGRRGRRLCGLRWRRKCLLWSRPSRRGYFGRFRNRRFPLPPARYSPDDHEQQTEACDAAPGIERHFGLQEFAGSGQVVEQRVEFGKGRDVHWRKLGARNRSSAQDQQEASKNHKSTHTELPLPVETLARPIRALNRPERSPCTHCSDR